MSDGRRPLVERTADVIRGGLANATPEDLLSIFGENLLMGTGVQVIFGDEILRRLRAGTPASGAVTHEMKSRKGASSPPDLNDLEIQSGVK